MATPTQIRRRGRWSLILGTIFAAVLFAAVAYADEIENDLDGSAYVMALNEGGANGSTELTVVPKNGDGKQGCNLTGSTTLVVSVSSSATSVATVSPSSLTFGSCSDVRVVTVTPVAEGTANVTINQTSNNTSGSFDLTKAQFSVNVAPPPNTAPDVTVTGVTHGAEYVKGSVPVAGCSVEDVEDGNSTFPASLSAITGTYASDGLGNQTATCSYTDGGGIYEEVTATYSIYDASAPGISSGIVGTLGNNNWYVSNVALTWTVTENESPNSLAKTGCVDQSITADQAATTYSCSASSAGGSTGPVSVSIKRDATAPLVSGAPTTSPNVAGWYKSDVVIDWTCSDATSGLAAGCPADSTISSEGAGLTASSGNVFDLAGNFTNATSSPAVKIDKTAPTVALVDGPAAGGSYYFGSVPAAPTCTASDGLSGVAGSCSVSGYSAAVGSHTVSASATDVAGNVGSSGARGYSVLAWTLNGFFQPVDMGSSVWNTLKSGSTVPLKFRVFAGSTELTDISAVQSVSYRKILCNGVAIEDAIEELAPAGGTLLRYDTTGGQFIYNLKTSGKAGECYRATMTTEDLSKIEANFKLK